MGCTTMGRSSATIHPWHRNSLMAGRKEMAALLGSCSCHIFSQMEGENMHGKLSIRQQFQLASLPPHLSFELKWGRFVNVHGGKGNNIPCDLFNEHQNKLFKDIIKSMGANMTNKAITKAARSVSTLHKFREEFDSETGVPTQTSKHSTRMMLESFVLY